MPRKRDVRRDMKKEWKADWKSNGGYYKWKYHSHHKGLACFWFAGWLFTVGLLKLAFWKAVLAIIIWAYYLGVYFAGIWHP